MMNEEDPLSHKEEEESLIVIFRLCYNCLAQGVDYCDSCLQGYGDYMIGLNTFLKIFFILTNSFDNFYVIFYAEIM